MEKAHMILDPRGQIERTKLILADRPSLEELKKGMEEIFCHDPAGK